MMFFWGLSVGLSIAGIIVTVMVYFRHTIDSQATVIEKRIENAGPRPKGFIHMPESEAETIRNQIIENNKKEGRDTPISELL